MGQSEPPQSGQEYRLDEDDSAFLKAFWLLQFMRTDAAARTTVELWAQLDDELGGLPPGYEITVREEVQSAMRRFLEQPDLVIDLGVRLVRNTTDHPFVTSDNPAAMTNRWHLTDRRAPPTGPGLMSAGIIGMLPLAPDMLCVIYDTDVYSVSHRHGWLEVSDPAEVDAFNCHQVLACQSNLYFRGWEHREYVSGIANSFSEMRLPARYQIRHAILDRDEDGKKTYVEVTAEEARNHRDTIVHMLTTLPVPPNWPHAIRWRAGGVVYDSLSGAGFVRKAWREPDHAYVRVRLRP